jgi:hypothetical protein
MPKFLMQPLLGQEPVTARLGTTGAPLNDNDAGKLVKLIADSNYDLCAVGDTIEGYVQNIATAPIDGFSLGGVIDEGRMYATADGSQAAGTGALAIGDYVVCGQQPAKGSPLPATGAYVRKATWQPGVSSPAALTDVPSLQKVAMWAWRVVSLGTAGTGAVGSQIVIERVND